MNEHRHEARARGLRWAAVLAAYRQIKQTEREIRQHPNAVRASAWMMHTASRPACWPFWRHGFLSRYGRRLARGADLTVISGYDEIGQQIASEFSEYAGDDGTERLFDFLLSPYNRLPDRDTMLRAAVDLAEHWQNRSNEPDHENLERLEF